MLRGMAVKIICCLAMICSCSFAGGLWTSSKMEDGLVADVTGHLCLDRCSWFPFHLTRFWIAIEMALFCF